MMSKVDILLNDVKYVHFDLEDDDQDVIHAVSSLSASRSG